MQVEIAGGDCAADVEQVEVHNRWRLTVVVLLKTNFFLLFQIPDAF